MKLGRNFVILILACSIIALNADTNSAQGLLAKQDDDTTTTTDSTTTTSIPTTTTTTSPTTTTSTTTPTTTTSSTTTTTPETTTTTTTTTSSSTTTAQTTTTTTTAKTTTTTTQAPATTTTPAPALPVQNFTVSAENGTVCLRAMFALSINITYVAKTETQTSNQTAGPFVIEHVEEYHGVCADEFNTLVVKFKQNEDWTLSLNYTLKKNTFSLDTVELDYVVDETLFPHAVTQGKQTVKQTGLNEFSASKGNSYKCWSKNCITVDQLSMTFQHYQAEPFSDGKSKDFDTAVECSADQTNTSELVPIIVGSALAVLVIFVLIAYIVGRRKHRPGYQQV